MKFPAVLLALASTLVLFATTARGQTFPLLSCIPNQDDTTPAAQPFHVTVDCTVTVAETQSPGATVTANADFNFPSSSEVLTGCHGDAGLACKLNSKLAVFTCPSPDGCPAGSAYTFTIQFSSSKSGDLYGALTFAAGPVAGPLTGAQYGLIRSFVAMASGWHLVALPPGSELSGTTGPLYSLQPGDQSYQAVQPDQSTMSGSSYWVYTPRTAVATLAPGSFTSPAPIPVTNTPLRQNGGAYKATFPPQSWALLGDPLGIPGGAGVRGADAVYTYDPAQGYQIQPSPPYLAPGQGVLVYSSDGGTIGVGPVVP